MSNIFHPLLLISYHDQQNSVLIFTYNIEGEKHFGEPREMKHENLPILLFQLADKGYLLEPKGERLGFKQIIAHSPEYVAKQMAKLNKEQPR